MLTLKYSITQKLIPIKKDLPNRRGGSKIKKVRFLVAHDTGVLNAPANNFYRNYINQPAVSASAHIFVDDKEIIEVIPSFENPEKAWHVMYDKPKDNQLYGVDANDGAIGVELCWFSDKARSQKAYEKYVWVLAYLCYYHKLDPQKDVVGHEILDPQRKIDPTNGLKYSGHTYKGLLADIKKEYDEIVRSANAIDTIEDACHFLGGKAFTDVEGWIAKAKTEPKLRDLFMAMAKGWNVMMNTKYFDIILQNILKCMKG